jgi:hypothetical protein
VDLLDILRVVRKRWQMALLAAIGGIVLLVLASGAVEPDWDGTAIVWVEPPSSEITITDIGEVISEEFNILIGVDAAANAVPLLAVQATSQETRTTFAQNGLSTAYEIVYIQRQPYMTISVTDGDPDLVVSTVDSVIDFIQSKVTEIQDEANIEDSSRAKITTIAETEIAANNTNKRRAQGVIFVLTVIGAVAAATLTDLYFRKRDESAHTAKYGPGTEAIDTPTATPVLAKAPDDGDAEPAEKPNRWQRDSSSS